jgi:hypothetical protein
MFRALGSTKSWLVASIMASIAISSSVTSPASLANYNIFRVVDDLVPEHYAFYAGDQWVAWPAVFRELMQGKSSFGLTGRGEGNAARALKAANAQISAQGFFPVVCLHDPAENCLYQIQSIVGPVIVIKRHELRKDVVEFELARGDQR